MVRASTRAFAFSTQAAWPTETRTLTETRGGQLRVLLPSDPPSGAATRRRVARRFERRQRIARVGALPLARMEPHVCNGSRGGAPQTHRATTASSLGHARLERRNRRGGPLRVTLPLSLMDATSRPGRTQH